MDRPEAIVAYLVQLEVDFEEIGPGMWIVNDEFDDVENMVINFSPPIVVFRVKLMNVPEGDNSALYKKLLELNGNEMISGAYGIEDDVVIATETLQSENLDFNEFQAAIEGLTMALTEHYQALREFVRA